VHASNRDAPRFTAYGFVVESQRFIARQLAISSPTPGGNGFSKSPKADTLDDATKAGILKEKASSWGNVTITQRF
jgi:hypothetical protein